MRENEISEKVIGCAIEVHRQLGHGLLESVSEEALFDDISKTVPKLVDGVHRVVNKLHEE